MSDLLGPRPEVTSHREDRREQALVRARLFPSAAHAETVGKYRLRARVGAGASGVVYEAVDDELGRTVALKILQSDAGERAWSEAQALARVSHPNVVAVYDVGRAGNDLYIAMELVQGPTVGEWIEQSRPHWRDIVAVFAQAAAGLSAAHEAGLIHRDVKPANLRIGAQGRVQVVDFGLAVPCTGGDGTTGASGTPAFMAPEQMRGEAIDARADQYGLGASLEAAVAQGTGRVPRAVLRAIARSMAPAPADRWPSMAAFESALQRLSVRRRGRRLLATAALMMLAAIGATLAVRSRTDRVPAPAPVAHDARLYNVRWNAISQPAGHYRVSLDDQVSRSGSSSGRIDSVAGTRGVFGAMAKTAPAESYRGKRVRMTAWLRTRNAQSGAGIWFRVDDRNGVDVAFDNMRGRMVYGTNDWVQVQSVLDVPDHGWSLVFGASLRGGGQVWLDDVALEVVDADTPVTGAPADLPAMIVDGSFEHTGPPLAHAWELDTLTPGQYVFERSSMSFRGERSARLRSTAASVASEDSGAVVQWLAAERYRGHHVRLTAALRGQVDGGAMLVLASDGNGSGPPPQVPVRVGDTWRDYSLESFVLPTATEMAVGARIDGRGDLWIDDVRIEIVARPRPALPAIDAPLMGLDFEPGAPTP